MRIVTRSLMITGFGVALVFAASPSVWAGGCCSMGSGHGGAAMATEATQTDKPAPAVVSNVLEQYAKVQAALASDSTDGIRNAAQTIAKQVENDADKTLPADVAVQADTLAKAKGLTAAREAFKPLSASLTQYLSTAKVQTGHYFQMHCGMAKADWLQTDKSVKNPYYGSSMLKCGQLVAAY